MNSALYDPQEYIFHPSLLDKPRKLGLSGVLVTRADSLTVGAAIDSCIESIDELIIVLHAPDDQFLDNTKDIVHNKQDKLPDKIKIFEYKAGIFHIPGGEPHGDKILNKGIHAFANLVNYGMEKSAYSHYMRIDGDHLYFKDQIKEVRDYIVKNASIFDIFGNNCSSSSSFHNVFYTPHINIFPSYDAWYVSRYQKPSMEIFSGLGDHAIHPISSDFYYVAVEKNGELEYPDRLIAALDTDIGKKYTFNWLGFFSWHLKHVALFKRYGKFQNKIPHLKKYHDEVFLRERDSFSHLGNFLELSFSQLNIEKIPWMEERIKSAWEHRFHSIDSNVLELIGREPLNSILRG